MQYFGKRFLSPYLGRWLSPDPLAVHAPGRGDLNTYAYVRGALLKSTDPLGLEDDDGGRTRMAIENLIALVPGKRFGQHGEATTQGAKEVLSRALLHVDNIHVVHLKEAQAYFLRTKHAVMAGAWVDEERTLRVRFDAHANLPFGQRGGPMTYDEGITTQMLGHELYHAYQQRVVWQSSAGIAARDRGVSYYEGLGYSEQDSRTLYGEAMADAFGYRVRAYVDAKRQISEQKRSKDGLTQQELDDIAGQFEQKTSRLNFGYRYNAKNDQVPTTDPMSQEMLGTVRADSGISDRFIDNKEFRSAGKPSWEKPAKGK